MKWLVARIRNGALYSIIEQTDDELYAKVQLANFTASGVAGNTYGLFELKETTTTTVKYDHVITD
jgi:hypothetical protein